MPPPHGPGGAWEHSSSVSSFLHLPHSPPPSPCLGAEGPYSGSPERGSSSNPPSGSSSSHRCMGRWPPSSEEGAGSGQWSAKSAGGRCDDPAAITASNPRATVLSPLPFLIHFRRYRPVCPRLLRRLPPCQPVSPFGFDHGGPDLDGAATTPTPSCRGRSPTAAVIAGRRLC